MWIGIDAGGTFTDVVGYEPDSGTLHVLKEPSTPDAPARAILEGIRAVLAMARQPSTAVERVHHGTTVATNALLQQRLARTGMVTTAGFRDVMDIARQRRPHLFDLAVPKPDPIAPRALRVEIRERLDERGTVVEAASDADVRESIDVLRAANCEAVGICFLHAYANPAHEEQVKAMFVQEWPGIRVCTSNEVLSEMREYERFATTLVNAGLLPLMSNYLNALNAGVDGLGVKAAPRIMQSNGGTVSTRSAADRPVTTFVSGPAAGVIASVQLGNRTGIDNLLTFDMGGTSTDVCVVKDGRAAMQNERTMAGLPLRVRALGIHTVGAGGGSIGWIDEGGLLKVGPQSAGAHPGPAAYARGGTAATVTDANLLLGRLSPSDLLAGHLKPSLAAATEALTHLGAPLGLNAHDTAAGMLRIVHTSMTGALRVVSVERGLDPRDFALVAFGGAGPLHAAELAAHIGLRKIIVPPLPGLASAVGLLVADARADFSLTVPVELDAPDADMTLSVGFRELRRRADAWLATEGYSTASADFSCLVDVRYIGQSFELGVPIDTPAAISTAGLSKAFHDAHAHVNGYASRDHGTEAVTLRVTVQVPNDVATAVANAARVEANSPGPVLTRDVWFESQDTVATKVRARASLERNETFIGPAVITQMDATTLIPPLHTASIDQFDNLIIERQT